MNQLFMQYGAKKVGRHWVLTDIHGIPVKGKERAKALRIFKRCAETPEVFAKALNAEWWLRYNETQTRRSAPTPKAPPREGWVYLMHNKRNGLFKIGFSANPTYREATLQSEEPEIELVHKFRGTMKDEEALHRRYAANRVRGEWFKLNSANIERIKQR